MPATSEKQRRMMAAARAYKRGETTEASDAVKELAASMSDKDLTDFMTKEAATRYDTPAELREAFEQYCNKHGYAYDELLIHADVRKRMNEGLPKEAEAPNPWAMPKPSRLTQHFLSKQDHAGMERQRLALQQKIRARNMPATTRPPIPPATKPVAVRIQERIRALSKPVAPVKALAPKPVTPTPSTLSKDAARRKLRAGFETELQKYAYGAGKPAPTRKSKRAKLASKYKQNIRKKADIPEGPENAFTMVDRAIAEMVEANA